MKTLDQICEELKNDQELNNAWIEAKNQNNKMKKRTIIIFAIIDLLILLILKGTINSIWILSYLLFRILVMNVIFGVIVFIVSKLSKKQTRFVKEYKNKVIQKIIGSFYNNLEYFPNKPMPEYIYNKPQYEFYNNYISNDYFEATIDNKYCIQVAEVETQEERAKNGYGKYDNNNDFDHFNNYQNQEKEIITKFNGLFAKIDIEKSINSELRIMQDGKFALEKNKLNMDSSEFEKYFDVKASNNIIAMQLLTADIMEELVQFANETKMEYDICVKNNELYLRFHSGNLNVDIAELKNGVLDKKIMNKYFNMIKFTYNLSKKIIETINDVEI